MSPKKSTISINNKQYDITTGQPIGSSAKTILPNKSVINDVVRPQHAQPKTVTIPKPKPAKIRSSKISEAKYKTEKSTTLMRPAVKKPTHYVKPAQSKEQPTIAPAKVIHHARLQRAKTTPKSHKISRFHRSEAKSALVKKHETLAVKEPSTHQPKPTKHSSSAQSWPVIDQFEKAMQEASSHLETFAGEVTHSKKRRRKLAYTSVSVIAVLLLGFGVYQVVPTAKIKFAGNKAGFSPSLPSYSPAGFGLSDPVAAQHGQVTLSYKSRTDDKGFKITQTPSEWSSQSLENNFLKQSGKDYDSVKINGKTIYTYDGSNATWVDSGIWFKLEGSASLSNDQLIKIANGL